jgi:hypothetical protein
LIGLMEDRLVALSALAAGDTARAERNSAK